MIGQSRPAAAGLKMGSRLAQTPAGVLKSHAQNLLQDGMAADREAAELEAKAATLRTQAKTCGELAQRYFDAAARLEVEAPTSGGPTDA